MLEILDLRLGQSWRRFIYGLGLSSLTLVEIDHHLGYSCLECILFFLFSEHILNLKLRQRRFYLLNWLGPSPLSLLFLEIDHHLGHISPEGFLLLLLSKLLLYLYLLRINLYLLDLRLSWLTLLNRFGQSRKILVEIGSHKSHSLLVSFLLFFFSKLLLILRLWQNLVYLLNWLRPSPLSLLFLKIDHHLGHVSLEGFLLLLLSKHWLILWLKKLRLRLRQSPLVEIRCVLSLLPYLNLFYSLPQLCQRPTHILIDFLDAIGGLLVHALDEQPHFVE